MESSRKNRQLHIDEQAVSALALAKSGLLSPVTRLLTQKEVAQFEEGKLLNDHFPFPFLLSPSGKRNVEVLKEAKKGDVLDLYANKRQVGHITVDEIFPIDKKQRLRQIYGTDNLSHPGIQATAERIGPFCVNGAYEVDQSSITSNIEMIERAKIEHDVTHMSAIMIAANPLHRGHERLIRQALEKTDLLILFLLKPYQDNSGLDFDLRYKVLNHFITNFLPKNRVLIVPFETNYLFAGYNEIILDAIVAKNYGCNKLLIGKNHAGIGLFFDHNQDNSILDTLKDIDIEIETVSDFVYCNICKTLVSTKTCPHGQHHHISYHADSILELMRTGLLPPAVLVRKDISAMILTHLYPNRFKNLEKLYYDILPNTGILEEHNEHEFYLELMSLYQTTSLT